MYEWRGGGAAPEFNQELADTYVGKYMIVGLTYCDTQGRELRRVQMHGVIETAAPDGIKISLRGKRQGESWTMPPVLDAIQTAEPGSYRLRETGEVIENPDLLSTWNVTEPQKH